MRASFRLWPAVAALAVLGAFPCAAAAQAPAAAEEPAAPQHSPVYSQMRTEALTIDPAELVFEGRRPRVWGAVMEVGSASGHVATLVTFADGTTSLLSSAGGGIMGSGGQREVRRTSDAFLQAAATAHRGMTDITGEHPIPAAGRVRFYVRTNAGLRTAEATEDELKAGSHALSALYTAGREVLVAVRPLSGQTP
jgi:hypothetical protein